MVSLPELENAFEYENNFYFTCEPGRLGKIIAHYELFKRIIDLPGEIIEFGVFKGVSLLRFAMLRNLLSSENAKKIVGFDTFDKFPETKNPVDAKHTMDFINEAGNQSISTDALYETLEWRGVNKNIELIRGDISYTLPEYVKLHPELKVALLHIDVDLYEPSKVILELLYSKVVPNGVIILDDYATFGGETIAVDEFFKGKEVEIKKFPFILRPSYILKKA